MTPPSLVPAVLQSFAETQPHSEPQVVAWPSGTFKKLFGGDKVEPPASNPAATNRPASPDATSPAVAVSSPVATSSPPAIPSPVEAPSGTSEAAVATPASPVPPPVPGVPSAGDFLPVKRQELLEKGEEVRRTTGWMWFGRRDIIPPISDPRTLLIDRGMLTQGHLTAEELWLEIHRATATNGAKGTPTAAGAHQPPGSEASLPKRPWKRTGPSRAEVKVRKKAESAERNQKRKEAIEHRKATDITFVGKGVSALLADRTSDSEKLAALGLPLLQTPMDFSSS